jgi:phosphoglycerate dehydrogenase-like enzyme
MPVGGCESFSPVDCSTTPPKKLWLCACIERLLSEANMVSLHASLTPERRHLLGAVELYRLRPHALPVNTA